jgi:hypothetical protein
MATPEELLSNFIDAWNAGERPRVPEYLAKAPAADREELAALIRTFLEQAPTPDYSPEKLAAIASEPAVKELSGLIESQSGFWPSLLPRLRRRSKLTRDQVVAQLAGLLGLEGREPRIHPYYHQMETGTIDPRGVSRRVLEGLAKVFKVDVKQIEEAGDFTLMPPSGAPAYLRSYKAREVMGAEAVDFNAPASPGAPMDEVDQLFLGGR